MQPRNLQKKHDILPVNLRNVASQNNKRDDHGIFEMMKCVYCKNWSKSWK